MSMKCSIGMPTCRNSASIRVDPASRILRSTSCSRRRRNDSPIRSMIAPRSRGVIRGHGPSSNALRAAATARSTSAGVACGTVPITSSVAGLTTSRASSPLLSTHSPSMYSR